MSALKQGSKHGLPKVKEGTNSLSALRAQNTRCNGRQPIQKLAHGDQWENRRDEIDHL
jgi:hypothetical protein